MRDLFDFKLVGLDTHLWRVFMPGLESSVMPLKKFMTIEQAERGTKLARPTLRTRFIIRTATLRLLLSKYMQMPPSKIRYGVSAFGKPYVETPEDERTLQFNVSHSEDWLFIAFSRNGSIGVDVECVKHDFPVTEIAQRFFTPSEASMVAQANGKGRTEIFFRIWVRKEAYLKAIGQGLYLDLKSFETPIVHSMGSGDNPDVQTCSLVGTLDERWYFYDIPAMSGYCACLVTDFKPHSFQVLDLNSPESLRTFQLFE